MSKYFKICIPIIAVITAIVGSVVISEMPQKPEWFQFIDEKLHSIHIPLPQIGIFAPDLGLVGTWKSSTAGKGLELFGEFTTGPIYTTVYEDGDIEIIINSVKGNTASGEIRYPKLCASATTTAPKMKPITVSKCADDSGYLPLSISVSKNTLYFNTVIVNGAKVTMQGTYSTDVMTGSMMANVLPYGVIKGVFNLNRVK